MKTNDKYARCRRCVFRTGETEIFRCNYAGIMFPETRGAQAIEKCTYFMEGPRRRGVDEYVPEPEAAEAQQRKGA